MISERETGMRGYTLVELLIAMVVTGFGLLGLCDLQMHLTRHADVSRHRAEATRLAQQQLESMRGFGVDLVSGDDEPSLPGGQPFQRRWSVAAGEGESQRVASVTVAWTDNTGNVASATVMLSTVIGPDATAESGSVAVPLIDGDVRRAHQRHLAIPIVATHMHGTNRRKSVMPWVVGYLVFDDISGAIVARCAEEPRNTTDWSAACSPTDSLLVEGYIDGLDASIAEEVHFEQDGNNGDCRIEQATDRNTGDVIGGKYRYQCVVAAAALDAGGAPQLELIGLPADRSACRYTGDDEAANPSTYSRTSARRNHRSNLLVATASCPSGTLPSSSA